MRPVRLYTRRLCTLHVVLHWCTWRLALGARWRARPGHGALELLAAGDGGPGHWRLTLCQPVRWGPAAAFGRRPGRRALPASQPWVAVALMVFDTGDGLLKPVLDASSPSRG